MTQRLKILKVLIKKCTLHIALHVLIFDNAILKRFLLGDAKTCTLGIFSCNKYEKKHYRDISVMFLYKKLVN